MDKIKSSWLFLVIQFERALDHAWRQISGFPSLKRSEITPQIYLGGQYSPKSLGLLKKLGITGILSMRMRKITNPVILENFHIMHLPTPDQFAPELKQLYAGVDFIKTEIINKGKVYIHCRAGEGRGPTMAIAYLISTGMTFDDALKSVKKVRRFINPTPPQIKRLKEFSESYNPFK